MQKLFFVVFVTLSLFISTAAQSKSPSANKGANLNSATIPSSKDPLGDADQLFSRGENLAQDQQSLTILERALTNDGKNYELLWRAARSAYYVGDFGEQEAKVKFFEKGIVLAQRAVALQPDSVEGHFWLAANYGGKAQLVGALKALATVKKIRNEMQMVVKLKDTYENGNAYLALGEIDRELPGVMGGNKKRALSLFEQGLKVAPENLDLKVALAKAYKDAGRKDEAQRLLEEVVKAQATTRIQRDAQVEARQILSKQ
ncbi:MAG: tetratricopeptide repeat protein [Acidobacteria bacterium]|nr:tetratricopeptide repeat protein [Acidobacteriota bacterium]